MNLYFVIVCVCFIFVCFGVGESILKLLNISKRFALINLLILILLSFVPPIKIFGIVMHITYAYFFYLTCYFILKLRAKYILKSLLIASICCLGLIVYYSIVKTTYDFMFFQPYFIVFSVVGLILPFICKSIYACFVGAFLGLNIAYVILFKLSNIFIETVTLGEQMIFDCTLSCVIGYSFSYAIYILIKVNKYKKLRNEI